MFFFFFAWPQPVCIIPLHMYIGIIEYSLIEQCMPKSTYTYTYTYPWSIQFLVACYATEHPALSVHPSVGWSVGHTFTFFINCILLTHHKSF